MIVEELPAGSESRTDMEIVVHASERARALVQQILAFSREHDFVARPVDLAQVIRDALALMRAGLPASIQIVEHIADVASLVGDPSLLHQVVVNLMTNAAQAIGDAAGTITITLASVGAEGARLSIADTGCGMDDATVNRVFEPFFTTRPVGGGSGLGLAVAHGIIASHQGRIKVRSKPGAGSEFEVILPTHEDRPADAPAEAAVA
jgi:signal transduction histidine kinase